MVDVAMRETDARSALVIWLHYTSIRLALFYICVCLNVALPVAGGLNILSRLTTI